MLNHHKLDFYGGLFVFGGLFFCAWLALVATQ